MISGSADGNIRVWNKEGKCIQVWGSECDTTLLRGVHATFIDTMKWNSHTQKNGHAY